MWREHRYHIVAPIVSLPAEPRIHRYRVGTFCYVVFGPQNGGYVGLIDEIKVLPGGLGADIGEGRLERYRYTTISLSSPKFEGSSRSYRYVQDIGTRNIPKAQVDCTIATPPFLQGWFLADTDLHDLSLKYQLRDAVIANNSTAGQW